MKPSGHDQDIRGHGLAGYHRRGATKATFATLRRGAAEYRTRWVFSPFADGHARRRPRLTGGPFRFLMYGYDFS